MPILHLISNFDFDSNADFDSEFDLDSKFDFDLLWSFDWGFVERSLFFQGIFAQRCIGWTARSKNKTRQVCHSGDRGL